MFLWIVCLCVFLVMIVVYWTKSRVVQRTMLTYEVFFDIIWEALVCSFDGFILLQFGSLCFPMDCSSLVFFWFYPLHVEQISRCTKDSVYIGGLLWQNQRGVGVLFCWVLLVCVCWRGRFVLEVTVLCFCFLFGLLLVYCMCGTLFSFGVFWKGFNEAIVNMPALM